MRRCPGRKGIHHGSGGASSARSHQWDYGQRRELVTGIVDGGLPEIGEAQNLNGCVSQGLPCHASCAQSGETLFTRAERGVVRSESLQRKAGSAPKRPSPPRWSSFDIAVCAFPELPGMTPAAANLQTVPSRSRPTVALAVINVYSILVGEPRLQ